MEDNLFMNRVTTPDVYIYKQADSCYADYPYHPEVIYPEFKNYELFSMTTQDHNETYSAVRELFHRLGFDSENYGTERWNPLREFIQRKQKVVIKPNLVYHEHPLGEQEVLSMITNAAVIRPIIDYVLLATDGDVDITIGDAPVQGGDFDRAAEVSGIKGLIDFYGNQNVPIKLVDFRILISTRNSKGILAEKHTNPLRDNSMYRTVDLGQQSELMDVIDKAKRFEITDYGFGSVKKHHNAEKNEYIIPAEILEAALFINVPKLKTHRKAGLTCAMKNLVGINGDKTCLAHHTRGVKSHGGDEFNRFEIKTYGRVRIWAFLKTSKPGIKIAGLLADIFRKFFWKGKDLKEHSMLTPPSVFFEGSWSGNDTIWRCVKDINKILLYADVHGVMQEEIQRKYLCVVDAVLAGEGEGPMEQTTKSFGVIFGGTNAVYVDYTAAKLMKFDYKKIPVINQGFINKWWDIVDKDPKEIILVSNTPLENIADRFLPTFGWRDYL